MLFVFSSSVENKTSDTNNTFNEQNRNLVKILKKEWTFAIPQELSSMKKWMEEKNTRKNE